MALLVPITSPHTATVEAVAAQLETDPQRGLREDAVAARREKAGWNELTAQAGVPLWRRVMAQLADALVLLLLGASAVSAVVWYVERETPYPYEALVILTIVVLNAGLSLFQEGKAEQALAALRAMAAPEVTVLRDGAPRRVPNRDVVPGDVLVLEEGDLVAADARLVECVGMRALEAALTGESEPVEKQLEPVEEAAGLGDRTNMVFAGTAVSMGHARAMVTATGMETELGRIAGMLRTTEKQLTPLQRELDRTGKQLGVSVLVIAALMVGTLLLVEGIQNAKQVVQVLLFGVALAVAAAPEGLAAVVTVVLAMGVTRMARRGAIVRKLPAVETLGSATVICTDKTGTLTRNEMTVRALETATGKEEPALLLASVLANNASVVEEKDGRRYLGDPTEVALLVAAEHAGVDVAAARAKYPRVGEVPFTSERKQMSTEHDGPAGRVGYAKGAVGRMLESCTQELVGDAAMPLTEPRRAAILAKTEELAAKALRVLGVATGKGERELTFLGLVGMMDPPREEAKAAVAQARTAGIRPVMITGDHPATAMAIAREVGIADDPKVVTGAELDREFVAGADVYARVNPEHKLRIVQALQATGAVVAMTGDGVNDAPALKAADIGIAMGKAGTDVAKQAADLILTDDNFATIVAAVEEGRAVFDNIRKFLRYLLSSNAGEVMTVFFGVVLARQMGLEGDHGFVLPLLATQILWINLVTDGAPALALGADPASPDLMTRSPRAAGAGVIDRGMGYGIVITGLVMAAGTLAVLDASMPGGFIAGAGSLAYGRTMTFTTLVIFQIFNAFNCRSDERSAFDGLFANRWLWAATVASLALHVLVIYVPVLRTAFSTVPLSGGDWLLATAVASSVLWVSEAIKWARRAGLLRVG
jgi:Ca2+-transporting ATPase